MRYLKAILNFYINSSLHVAFAVLSLTYITILEHKFEPDTMILGFVFFSSISGYNFVKYFGFVKFHHRNLATWLKLIQLVSFISFSCMSYFFLKLNTKTQMCSIIMAVLTFFYAMPVIPERLIVDNNHNLREIKGFKVYIIALVWSITTVILPILNKNEPLTIEIILSVVQRFLFVLVLMLPFEIRDLKYDSLKLSTIPQKIGVKKSKLLGIFLLLLIGLLQFFKEIDPKNYASLIICLIITAIFLLKSHKNQSQYYSAVWVEGIPMFWLVAVLFFR